MNDRDIAVTNTSADQNLLTTVITKNPEVQYGLDGIVFNEAGDLFVGNFGDGAIHRIKMDAEGKVVSNDVWARIRLSFVPQTVCASMIKEIFG